MESKQKNRICTSLGLAIGTGIGWYVFYRTNQIEYAFLGPISGFLFGYFAVFVFKNKLDLTVLASVENITNIILGILGFTLAIMGIIGFFMTGKWVGIVGAIFFSTCSLVIIKMGRH